MSNQSESTGGYNPLRWICKERGLCWNLEHRPNIEYFAHAIPGTSSMTDIDGTVEVNHNFLFMEFKSPGVELTTGQRIYFQRLTKLSQNITVVVVDGVCRSMSINRVQQIWRGNIGPWKDCDLDSLFALIENWAANVKEQIVHEGAA